MVSVTTPDDADRGGDTQPASTSSAGARNKFRLLSSLPRAFFSFDRRSSTNRRASADASNTAATGAGNSADADTALVHGPHRLLISLGLADSEN